MQTTPKSPGIFARMGQLWTRFDFVDQVIMKDENGIPTMYFWFFWNTLFAILISVIFTFQFQELLLHFEQTGGGLLLEAQTNDPERFQMVLDLWKSNPESFLWTIGGVFLFIFWILLVLVRFLFALIMAWIFCLWGSKGMGKKNFTYRRSFFATLHVAIVPLVFATVFLINGWFMPELYFLMGVFIMGMNLRNLKNQ